jgi:hypothetical protein
MKEGRETKTQKEYRKEGLVRYEAKGSVYNKECVLVVVRGCIT